MRGRPFVIALLVPICVTAATLASVSRNRSSARDAIVLSDREVYLSPRAGDNTTATVWVAWRPSAALAARMAARPLEVNGRQERSLPRPAYVALELNGPSFRALPIERERDRTTRLVAIDIDRDAGVLEARYPNPRTHLISAATVRLPPGASYAEGIILSLEPQQIHVPRDLAVQLPTYDPGQGRARRAFEIEVRYGRNYEPWVTGVRVP